MSNGRHKSGCILTRLGLIPCPDLLGLLGHARLCRHKQLYRLGLCGCVLSVCTLLHRAWGRCRRPACSFARFGWQPTTRPVACIYYHCNLSLGTTRCVVLFCADLDLFPAHPGPWTGQTAWSLPHSLCSHTQGAARCHVTGCQRLWDAMPTNGDISTYIVLCSPWRLAATDTDWRHYNIN